MSTDADTAYIEASITELRDDFREAVQQQLTVHPAPDPYDVDVTLQRLDDAIQYGDDQL